MRQRAWHHWLDTLPCLYEHRSLLHTRSETRSCRIISILDSRQDLPLTNQLPSINNPLLTNQDGVLFEVEGQTTFAAAAVINNGFVVQNGNQPSLTIVDYARLYPQYPTELRQLLQERERDLAIHESSLSEQEYTDAIQRIITEVELLFDADIMPFHTVKEAFQAGHDAGLTFLRDLAGTETFLDMSAAAQYANWQAKFVADRGGDPNALYELKYAILNKLIRRFIASRTHEQIGLSVSRGTLCVDVGISVQLMGTDWLAHHRGMHIPVKHLSRKTRGRINYLYPHLLDNLDPSHRRTA